ncbi:uncharacterized protein LOC100179023 [Ciona intestinalis]
MFRYQFIVILFHVYVCQCQSHLISSDLSTPPLQSHFDPYTTTQHAYKDTKFESTFTPGSKAQPFTIWTLDHGKISYPGENFPQGSPIGFHAYTNHSGFLDCMWTSQKSLIDFVNTSPSNVQYVFVTFDSNALKVATWMKSQLQNALSMSNLTLTKQTNFMKKSFFVITPVSELGNWIPAILQDWSCSDHGCGYNQVAFESKSWNPPVKFVKRVDARYDWAFVHQWKPATPTLTHVLDGCSFSLKNMMHVNGSVALVADSSINCTVAKKVSNLQNAGAIGVLVYSEPGFPLKDINCVGADCSVQITIPVMSIPNDAEVIESVKTGSVVTASLQNTPSPNFYFTIDGKGNLAEAGWFLYPSLQFLAWQMQWLVFDANLTNKISTFVDYNVPVFNHTVLQGKNGTGNVTVQLHNLQNYNSLYLDMSLGCVSDTEEGCPPWDHVATLYVCCETAEQELCGVEVGRWITAFRRGTGHWLTDVSALLPVFGSSSSTKCSFKVLLGAWWAKPWTVTLTLRFKKTPTPPSSYPTVSKLPLRPFKAVPLFQGGTFDSNYNKNHPMLQIPAPSFTSAIIYAVITGHGSDDHNCAEFCVTTHLFSVNNNSAHSTTFNNAGTPLGCAERVPEGVVPNEHGTWLYGRDGWCDGLQVDPWLIDISNELLPNSINNITYRGLFEGKDPNPKQNPGLIRVSSYLVFYH